MTFIIQHSESNDRSPQNLIDTLLSSKEITAENDTNLMTEHFNTYISTFTSSIEAHCHDPEVVGFKSIACYRGGLDIRPDVSEEEALGIFTSAVHEFVASGKEGFRLNHGILNDFLLCEALKLAGKYDKPGMYNTLSLRLLLRNDHLTIFLSSPVPHRPR